MAGVKLIGVLVLIGYIAGFITGRYWIFPYDEYRYIEKKLSQISRKYFESAGKKQGYWNSLVIPQGLSFEKSVDLNNFRASWAKLKDSRISKIGAAEFSEDAILYVNQDDDLILKSVGLTREALAKSGGIKALFLLNGRQYVYLAYSRNNCDSASIFDLATSRAILELPCLPDSGTVDLNGVGGGTVVLNSNELLLSTGTPTTFPGAISNLAQDLSSFWGKTIRISSKSDPVDFSIHSVGHRNPQAMIKYKNNVYAVEHGPLGGDELNLIKPTRNYGWPLHSLGSHYNSEAISKDFYQRSGSEIEQPLYAFLPSIGISDIARCPTVYEAYYAPLDCLSIASLRGQKIFFVLFRNGKVVFEEHFDLGARIRKFAFINNRFYAVTDYDGAIVGELKKR
jgi:hypothetical protein